MKGRYNLRSLKKQSHNNVESSSEGGVESSSAGGKPLFVPKHGYSTRTADGRSSSLSLKTVAPKVKAVKMDATAPLRPVPRRPQVLRSFVVCNTTRCRAKFSEDNEITPNLNLASTYIISARPATIVNQPPFFRCTGCEHFIGYTEDGGNWVLFAGSSHIITDVL